MTTPDTVRVLRLVVEPLAEEGIETTELDARPGIGRSAIDAAVRSCDAVIHMPFNAADGPVLPRIIRTAVEDGMPVFAVRNLSIEPAQVDRLTPEQIRDAVRAPVETIALLVRQHLANRPPVDLTLHPPVERPGADDAGMVVSDTEVLLSWAERFVADAANPDDVRDEVDARRRQTRGTSCG